MNKDFRIFWARILAYIIDVFILTVIILLIEVFIQLPWVLSVMFEDILTFSYFIYFHHKTGQTYGKKASHIKVVNNLTNSIISVKTAFLREAIWILAAVIHIGTKIIFPNIFTNFFMDFSYFASVVILLTILFDKNFRGVHDKIAGTKVVPIE